MGSARGPSSSVLGAPTAEERWDGRGQWAYLLIFAFSLAALAIFLRYHVASLYQNQIDAWEARLSSAADERAELISGWLEERRSDADLLATRPTIRRALLSRPGHASGLEAGAASDLQKVLDDTTRIYGYQGIHLVAPGGVVLAKSSGAPDLSPGQVLVAQAAMQSHQAQIEVTDGASGTQVAFLAPIFANGSTAPSSPGHSEALGAGVLIVDASRTLFRLLEHDTASTETAETVLVRREGNEAIYFSLLRHRPVGAPGLRVPLAQASPQVLDALNGRATTSTGTDYRGTSVLAATRRIPLAGWGLIRKIDRDEAMTPLRRQLITEGVAAGLWILLVGGALIAHRRRALAREGSREHQRLRAFLDLAPDAIYIIDPASLRILGRNKKAAAMDGYSDEELARLTAVDLHLPEEREEIRERLTGGRGQTLGPSGRAHYYRRKSGEVIPVEESQTRVKVGGQEFIVTIFHDVSDRQRAEEKLAESEERYRSVVAALAEGIVLQDESGTIIACNPSAERILGLTLDQMCGRTSIDPSWKAIREDGSPFPGETHPAMVSLRTGDPQTNVLMGVQKLDGTTSWISINAQPIWGEDREQPRAVVTSFSDVTARQQAEEGLRRSEARFRTLIDNSPIAVGISRNGTTLYVNNAYRRMFGFKSDEELVGRSLGQEWAPSCRQMVMDRAFRRSRGEAVPTAYEATGLRRDGTEFPVFIEVASVELPDGPATIGFLSDISQRRMAEEALRESEERLLQLAESMTQVFHLSDVQLGRLLYISPAYETVWGRTRQSLFDGTVPWPDTVHPDDRPRVMEIAGKLHQDGLEADSEYRIVRPDGSVRWVRDRAKVVFDAQGKVWRIAGLAEDITLQKQAQESLVKLKKAVDASGEVIFMTDHQGVITFINTQFTRLYGYTEAEVVGKTTPRILKSGNMDQEEYASFWNTILSKQVARVEMVNRTRDGRLVNIEATANPILDEKGEIAGFLAIQRDVTQHQRLEQQFRQAQKMEAVGQLAGGVAHDFNNLLTVINGYSEVLQERLKPDDPHQKYVTEIKKAGDRAAGLTRQLLAFSRQQVLAPQVLDVNKVIAGVHSMLNRIIGEDIELVTVPAQSLGLVKADPGQLEQVLLNLAVNSRDAMPRGGRLTLETGNIQIRDGHPDGQSVMPAGAYVMLAVSDSGSGMDAATQKRIFEPFFTTKEKGKGTGLGLSTVYGIVKQSGGYIWVYSEVGRGTTFKIYLPRIDEPAQGEEGAGSAAEVSLGSETILFAEDDAAIRNLVSETLERRGYTVLKAADAAEALVLLQEHQGAIQLLLTDLVMPGMSGRVLAERVTTLRPEVKVLYISGYTDDVMMRHGGIAPGTMFLQKPFAPDVLAAKVREALDGTASVAP